MGGGHDAGFWLLLVGYLVLSAGSYIGGHLVFKYGYMVNFNAFSKGKRAKEFTAVAPVADVPDGVPTKVMFGPTAVMLVRRGDLVHALKDTCSHAGGPLSEGELTGDTITCPWHFSTFRTRRWFGCSRAGGHAPGLVCGARQRRPGGAPGPARLSPLIG